MCLISDASEELYAAARIPAKVGERVNQVVGKLLRGDAR